MITTYEPEFLIDNTGKRTKVLLDYDAYMEILEIIEDIQDSKMIESVKGEPEISFEEFKRKRNFV